PREGARFSPDADWMAETVLVAKTLPVWMYQLARRFARPVSTLDDIPDEALRALSACGFTALWPIGLWQRSAASARIKQLRGNRDAAASAYALHAYRIDPALGGEEAFERFRRRCLKAGLRLCGDVVPNHFGLDSEWIRRYPERFIQTATPPYDDYRFTGPNLSADPAIELQLEDGYWDHSKAAVVFRHHHRPTRTTRYIYHGNDGTHLPWNDTAQLDYLQPEVRTAMIDLVVAIARRFDIIRFDAAMTLAKRHFQRLWYPLPGGGAGIPSRERFALSAGQFDQAFGEEFWRELVDTMSRKAPQTLLIAEAFWMLEGFFVRELGMHRVYNSAFMHMLRDGHNQRFRAILREIIATDGGILQRFVNFMNNPDEATAVEQFGKGDKYFAVAVLLATLPGLPLFGHGQVEGLREKYGMEFLRPLLDEQVDDGFFRHHQNQIFPLLRRRRLFAGAEHFHLLDLETPEGICEDVYAFCNRSGDEHALVLVNNSDRPVHGILHGSADQKAWPAIPGLPEGCRWLTGLEHHHRRRIWLDRR
ncbi:MAG: alpha-amylase, partial [Deltaproteobacteria bacterium]